MLWQWGNIFYWDIDNESDSAGMLACSYIRISFKVAIAQICFHFSQRRMSGQVRGASKGSLRRSAFISAKGECQARSEELPRGVCADLLSFQPKENARPGPRSFQGEFAQICFHFSQR